VPPGQIVPAWLIKCLYIRLLNRLYRSCNQAKVSATAAVRPAARQDRDHARLRAGLPQMRFVVGYQAFCRQRWRGVWLYLYLVSMFWSRPKVWAWDVAEVSHPRSAAELVRGLPERALSPPRALTATRASKQPLYPPRRQRPCHARPRWNRRLEELVCSDPFPGQGFQTTTR